MSKLMRAEISQETWQVLQIFEAGMYPEPPWPPYAGTNIIPVVIDLAGHNADAKEGDGFNPETNEIVYKPDLLETGWLGFIGNFVWNPETYSYDLSDCPELWEEKDAEE